MEVETVQKLQVSVSVSCGNHLDSWTTLVSALRTPNEAWSFYAEICQKPKVTLSLRRVYAALKPDFSPSGKVYTVSNVVFVFLKWQNMIVWIKIINQRERERSKSLIRWMHRSITLLDLVILTEPLLFVSVNNTIIIPWVR